MNQREDRPCWRSTRAVGSTGCETRSAAPVEFPAVIVAAAVAAVHPPMVTPLVMPVIAIIVGVTGAVSDGRGAPNAIPAAIRPPRRPCCQSRCVTAEYYAFVLIARSSSCEFSHSHVCPSPVEP